MDDKIKINLNMGGGTYPLTIDRKDEEMIRKAAKQVDDTLNEYRKIYGNVSQEMVMTMVAYQFSLENLRLKQRNDTEPYTRRIQELTEELEACFSRKEE